SATPVAIAKVHHAWMAIGADARWAFLALENALEPYLGVGAGVLFGSMSTSAGSASRDAGTAGILGTLSAGAAFGALGNRPFLELRVSGGRLFSDLATGGDAGYFQLDGVVGYRFELLADAAVD